MTNSPLIYVGFITWFVSPTFKSVTMELKENYAAKNLKNYSKNFLIIVLYIIYIICSS